MQRRALIVEDERLVRLGLSRLLEERDDVSVVGEAASVAEAATLVEREAPDLVFLDIHLPDGTGFDLFERVELRAQVVFLTAHVEFALRAFDVDAVDYVVKPISAPKLKRALRRAARVRAGERVDREPQEAPRLAPGDRVVLQDASRLKLCRVSDIARVQAAGDFAEVHLRAGSVVMTAQPLRLWEARLPECFLRVHRSTIVNLEHVAQVEASKGAWQLWLEGRPEAVPVSRRFAPSLKARLDALRVG
ncbi:MAG: LytTR family DNA-binding domain-containing protein [Myxococcota bacterium]